MKSVRLDAALETKLRAAARMEGVSESELIRQAIGQRCDTILANRADLRLGRRHWHCPWRRRASTRR